MKVHSRNEWGRLREIYVGSATGANWPSDDPVFSQESQKTLWKETPVPSGPVPNWVIEESNEDLQGLVDIIEEFGALVRRPRERDFVMHQGMYNYCPRDRLIIAGDRVIDPAMMYPCRDQEIYTLCDMFDGSVPLIVMPRDQGMILDAANISRLGDTWLFLESASGNRAAAEWLRQQLPDITIETCNFYSGVHIDSTIVPLREGTVVINAQRVRPEAVPQCLASWDKIWIDDCISQNFFQYPYASKWIGMNMLSLDKDTVIVDAAQVDIIKLLENKGFTVIPHTLRHSRTLGGGFHCVTLDTWRDDD